MFQLVSETIDGKRLRIINDDCPIDPRDMSDGPEAFVTFVPRHQSPDKTDYSTAIDYLLSLADEIHTFFSEWWHDGASPDELKEKQLHEILDKHYLIVGIGLNYQAGEWIPYSGYDLDDEGFIVLTQSKIDDEWKGKRDSAERYLRAVVQEYSSYASGDVWYYAHEERIACYTCGNVEWKLIDSCGGFYGTNWAENGIANYFDPRLVETLEER